MDETDPDFVVADVMDGERFLHFRRPPAPNVSGFCSDEQWQNLFLICGYDGVRKVRDKTLKNGNLSVFSLYIGNLLKEKRYNEDNMITVTVMPHSESRLRAMAITCLVAPHRRVRHSLHVRWPTEDSTGSMGIECHGPAGRSIHHASHRSWRRTPLPPVQVQDNSDYSGWRYKKMLLK